MVAFSLPLKGVERPFELPEEYRKTLRNEYQVRYLESIGAAPSRANMALVRKHIPIENCKFKTAWKSRGWSQDTLYISVDPPGSSSAAAAAAATAARATAATAATEGPTEGPTMDSVWQQLQAAEGEEEDEERGDEGQHGAPRGNMRFDEARRSFLYPFKLRPAQLEQDRRAAAAGSGDAEEEEEQREGRQEEAGRTADGFDWRSRDMHKYPLHPEEDIRAEMQAQFRLHTKDIVALQAREHPHHHRPELRPSPPPAIAPTPGLRRPVAPSLTVPSLRADPYPAYPPIPNTAAGRVCAKLPARAAQGAAERRAVARRAAGAQRPRHRTLHRTAHAAPLLGAPAPCMPPPTPTPRPP